jgi:hypothetical protein
LSDFEREQSFGELSAGASVTKLQHHYLMSADMNKSWQYNISYEEL